MSHLIYKVSEIDCMFFYKKGNVLCTMGQLRVKRLLLLWLQLFSISKALTTDDMNLTKSQNGQFTFLVMADLHSFTKVILPDVDLDVWKNTTTSILENIKNSFAPDGEIVLVPGDYASFGRLSNKYIAEVMGTSNENEAVYEASLATAKTMMQAFDMTGFTKVLPCLGDHELGKQ